MMKAIEVCRVTKSYGKVQALRSVSFDVKPGEVFGLIGPDGAGKTTMYRLLCSIAMTVLPRSTKSLVACMMRSMSL